MWLSNFILQTQHYFANALYSNTLLFPFSVINSSINILIYSFMSSKFRDEGKKIFEAWILTFNRLCSKKEGSTSPVTPATQRVAQVQRLDVR